MKQKVFFLAAAVCQLGLSQAFAQASATQATFTTQSCVSGNPYSKSLITQMAKAKESSPITKLIYSKYNLDKKENAACQPVSCETLSVLPVTHQLRDIKKAISPIPEAPQMLFKKECLTSSNTFKASTAQYSCPENRKVDNPCVTEDQLAYQNAVISNFLSCTAQEGLPSLNTKALYEMYSKESGFRPSYSYGGGVGIGQLTQVFVEDIHQKHRGFKFLKQIADSKNPACDAAKIIAGKDLTKKPTMNDRCDFISTGEGMERNILYSLVGSANSWEKDIEPVLRKYIEKYKNDPAIEEVKSLALMNSYGPGGRSAARAVVSRLTAVKPEQFIKAMKKPFYTAGGKNLTVYTTNIANRQNSIQKLLPEPIKNDFAQAGANACLTR